MRILVVDDDPSVRDLLVLHLSLDGHDVLTAVDGDAALEAVGTSVPHLVVLDLMMPKLSGWEVLERLRADERTRRTPVLVLSARDLPHDRQRARELGATAVLPKPFDGAVLSSTVSALLTVHTRTG